MTEELNPTPSAPVSAEPAAAPAAAPVSIPAAEPTPAAPVSSDPEESIRAAVTKAWPEVAKKAGFEKPQEPAKPAAVEPPKPAEPAKPAEEPKAEEKPPVEPAKPAENPLDKGGPVPAEKLAEALKDPAVNEALTKAGIDTQALMETSRRAALTDQYLEIFPTPDAAKFASENAEHFYKLEEAFPAIKSIDDTENFIMNVMTPLSIVYGADGQPQKNADGTFKTDGSVSRFLSYVNDFDQNWSLKIADELIKSGSLAGEPGTPIKEYGERLKEAIGFFQEFRKAGYKMPGGKPAELPPEHKAEMDRLRAQSADIDRRNAEANEASAKAFEDRLFSDIKEAIVPFVNETVNLTSLTDYEKQQVKKEIYKLTNEKMEADSHYQRQKSQLWNAGMTDETAKRITALSKTTFSTYASRIMTDVLNKAGAKRISANQTRQEKIDAQINNDKMNPTSSAPLAPKGPTEMSPADMNKKAREEFVAREKREPELDELYAEVLRIKGLRKSA